MNGITTQQAQPLNAQIEKLVDRVFEQLLASCPSLQYWTEQQIITAKRQWILGFAENNIKTIDQVRAGMRELRAKDDDFVPSIGKFINWCKQGNEHSHLGLPSTDELAKRVKAFMGYGFELEDQFAFANDLEYWLITDVYRKCKVNRWNDKQFDAGVKVTLDAWAYRLSRGESVPPRRQQLPQTVKVKTTLEQDLNYLAKMKAMLKGTPQGAIQ